MPQTQMELIFFSFENISTFQFLVNDPWLSRCLGENICVRPGLGLKHH